VGLDGAVGRLIARCDRVNDVRHRDDPLELSVDDRDAARASFHHRSRDVRKTRLGSRRWHVLVHQDDQLVLVRPFDQRLPRDQTPVLEPVVGLFDDRHGRERSFLQVLEHVSSGTRQVDSYHVLAGRHRVGYVHISTVRRK